MKICHLWICVGVSIPRLFCSKQLRVACSSQAASQMGTRVATTSALWAWVRIMAILLSFPLHGIHRTLIAARYVSASASNFTHNSNAMHACLNGWDQFSPILKADQKMPCIILLREWQWELHWLLW